MPYGAVVSGDLEGIPPRAELAVLAAGPLASGLTALAFVALWWLWPQTYPYTEAAARVSFSLFVVNCLPAFPLDGGRALRVLLRPLGARRARAVGLVLSLLTAAGVLILFVLSCFSAPNWQLLIFALCLAAGNFGGASYARIRFSARKRFHHGVREERIAISADRPLSFTVRFLREDRYLVLLLFEEEEFLAELPEEELLAAMQRMPLDSPLKAALAPAPGVVPQKNDFSLDKHKNMC